MFIIIIIFFWKNRMFSELFFGFSESLDFFYQNFMFQLYCRKINLLLYSSFLVFKNPFKLFELRQCYYMKKSTTILLNWNQFSRNPEIDLYLKYKKSTTIQIYYKEENTKSIKKRREDPTDLKKKEYNTCDRRLR